MGGKNPAVGGFVPLQTISAAGWDCRFGPIPMTPGIGGCILGEQRRRLVTQRDRKNEVRPETPLEQAERHVREGEARVSRQEEIIIEMERDHHSTTAETARKVLETLQKTLAVAREHLEIERRIAGKG